ncbi:ras association domain-containing protein 9 [Centropristis striata]|uniref:ras association domain-containing protein 9 n=1 Tax=Centropristis striata TaxID=184440 RepID=UPI0027E2093A|nr:ras association domain-containing protein 9 [Centropristis striata]
MAPFGKNFLKARQKNRTKDQKAEPVEGKEIQVTVCGEEKVVCGVTKHTTCADLIQALLDDHKAIPESKRLLHGEPKDFCLVERWKGFERALPPLTRILRLWHAWGDQRPFIQFTLVKTSDFVPPPAKKVGKTKGAKQRHGQHGQHPQTLPPERQKRLVKKAFRKLEKLHKESKSSPGSEEVDRMVQLILNQDHTIREQIQRMREMDFDIERVELQIQKEAEAESSSSPSLDTYSDEQLQEYLYTSDGVQQLEEQVQMHQKLILQLSRDIDAELRRDIKEEEGAAAAAASWTHTEAEEAFYAAELERLQDQVKHSLFTGVSLHTQTAEIDKKLKYFDATLISKDQECWRLAAQLGSLQIVQEEDEEEENEEEEVEKSSPVPETQCSVSQTVKLKHSLSPLDITDTDSDTGISSTHSQDSLSPCLDFPPPLDTDV